MYPVPTKAETQGQTDLTIGAWLRSRAGRRSEVVLATKVAGASERITWLRESRQGDTGVLVRQKLAAREGLPKPVSIQNTAQPPRARRLREGLAACCSPRNRELGSRAF